jgi:TfoX/Sxy family transcriptional regulator of competence genes
MGRKHKSVLLYLVKLADLNLEEFSREIQKPIPNVSSQSMNVRSDTNERSKILESVMAKYESVPEVLVDANDELIKQVNKARAQQGGTRRGKKRRNVKRHTTRR